MDVLLTGANGVVGTAITDHLGDDEAYTFTKLDLEAAEGETGDDWESTVVADVREYESIRPHFDGVDAVIHLALVPGIGPWSREIAWCEPLLDNLRGITNVYHAAVTAGVGKLLFASSNHAVGMVEVRNTPRVYHDAGIVADDTEPHRPDSLYGLSKCYGEDLGRFVAEEYGVQFYGLRIGAVRTEPYDHPFGDAERGVETGKWSRASDEYDEQVARMKGLWQSRRDLAHLVECCLQDDAVEWDHFYGVSANDRRWLDDLAHARSVIGYDPTDNGEAWESPPD